MGWLGAGLAETWHTLDHLAEAGAEYVADWAGDDLPFRMTLDRGTIMSIPYTLHCNDTVQFFDQKATAAEFGEIMRRQFDQLYKESAEIPRVMAVALHPLCPACPIASARWMPRSAISARIRAFGSRPDQRSCSIIGRWCQKIEVLAGRLLRRCHMSGTAAHGCLLAGCGRGGIHFLHVVAALAIQQVGRAAAIGRRGDSPTI